MMNDERNYNCIDLTRLLMAVLVIASHTGSVYGCTNPYILVPVHSIQQTSVLFFFLCTGFFLGKKMHACSAAGRERAVRDCLVKSVKQYVLWSAIYAPLALVYFFRSGFSVRKSIVSYLQGFFLLGQNYNSWMLWYLLSCIYALVFLILLCRRNASPARMTLLGGVVYLLGLMLTEFLQYDGPLPDQAEGIHRLLATAIGTGRIFTGFFFLPMGMLLAEKKPGPRTGVLLFLCGFAGDILMEDVAGSLFRGLTAIGIFVTAAGIRLKNRPLYSTLREMSKILYFTHMYVWTFYCTLVYGQETLGFGSFLATTLICLLIAYLFHAFSRRRHHAGL